MQLCDRYLPVVSDDSIWRFSRNSSVDDPDQGWKLHLSATILSANDLFRQVAPFLTRNQILFKAPKRIDELSKINSGLQYGFSQVGKFVTVYPSDEAHAVTFATKLHKLTSGFPSPTVPYDMRYKRNGCVHYRYGAFGSTMIRQGRRTISAVRMPDGTLVPDRREPGFAVPSSFDDP